MRAFKVSVNGKKLCVAGVGNDGVLSAIANWIGGRKDDGMDFLEVGGLVSPSREHVSWVRQKPLGVGDKIEIEVLEAARVDKPKSRHRENPAAVLEYNKRYVRNMAKQLGWRVVEAKK
ncbi:MAG TPA: hypothetical protein VFO39_22095 [Candidatus Sulfotelmatobacter sp.]|nr:hypothetical protein [Candidatus Sulfotelmatobacter sp.]